MLLPLFHSTALSRLSPASIRFATRSSASAHSATPTGCSPLIKNPELPQQDRGHQQPFEIAERDRLVTRALRHQPGDLAEHLRYRFRRRCDRARARQRRRDRPRRATKLRHAKHRRAPVETPTPQAHLAWPRCRIKVVRRRSLHRPRSSACLHRSADQCRFRKLVFARIRPAAPARVEQHGSAIGSIARSCYRAVYLSSAMSWLRLLMPSWA